MGIAKKTMICLLGLTTIFGALVAVDYHHGEQQRTEAGFVKRNKCFISFKRRDTLKAIAENYLAGVSTLMGRDVTRDTAEPVLKDGALSAKTKAKWAYRVLQIRKYGLSRCYNFPVSGGFANWAQKVTTPQHPKPQQ